MTEPGKKSPEEEDWTFVEVRETARGLLARRGHSRDELLRKLAERDVPRELAVGVCDALVEEGVLDDEAFARHQAEILRDNQWGPNQIRRKLGERGIDDDVIDEVLESVGGPEVWLRSCWRRMSSRFGDSPAEYDQKTKEKAYRHLAHRGYAPSLVRQILFDGLRPRSATGSQ